MFCFYKIRSAEVKLSGVTATRGRALLLTLASTVIAAGLLSCAREYSPAQPEDMPFMARAQTEERNGLRVTVAVLSDDESRQLFGVDLYAKGVQPVWIDIENNSDSPYVFLPIVLDPDYYSPNEVSWLNHMKFAGEANRRMDAHFNRHGIEDKFIMPGQGESGFLYTNLEPGDRCANDTRFNPGRIERFIFYIQVPGIDSGFQRTDFGTLYEGHEVLNLDSEDGLRRALEKLPCCSTDSSGADTGGPLNVILVGDPEDVFSALIRSGWDVAETAPETLNISKKQLSRTHRYRTLPIGSEYYDGRPQDAGLQKARDTAGGSKLQRNQIRLWLTPLMYAGKQVWTASVTRDMGTRISLNRLWYQAQQTDPDVDETREYLIEDLVLSQAVEKIGYAGGGREATEADPAHNLQGEPWWSDGLRAVIVIGDGQTSWQDVGFFSWESDSGLKALDPRTGQAGE